MASFLRVPARQTRAARFAERVLAVGDLAARPRLRRFLQAYFGEGLSLAGRLPPDGAAECDAILLAGPDARALGVASREALADLARGRQVLCDLPALAGLCEERLLRRHDGPLAGPVAVRHAAYFLAGFGQDDLLAWHDRGWAARGRDFGWLAPQQYLRVALQTLDGRIVAMEQGGIPDGRLAAIGLSALEEAPADGLDDLLGLLVVEALGAQCVDLGVYRATTLGYEAYVAEVEAWAKLHPDLVRLEVLEPESALGRHLRLLTVGTAPDRPNVTMACCTHGHEWATTYGVFAFLRHLVDQRERGTVWGRAVLDNLAIAWVPVVSVDGFDETVARGVLVPFGPHGVDLYVNYGPPELWERTNVEGRPKGPAPLSEPETQAMAAVLRRYGPQGRAFVDFHEACDEGFYQYAEHDPWLSGVRATLAPAFERRYLGQRLSGYNRDAGLHWHGYGPRRDTGVGSTGPHYARLQGFAHAMVAEFWGNDDYTPYHTIGRIDAAASFAEAIVGGVLGRTAYNHRTRRRVVRGPLADLPPDEPVRILRLAADGFGILDARTRPAGQSFEVPLDRGERMLAIRQEWAAGGDLPRPRTASDAT